MPAEPLPIWGDGARLTQVFSNLLNNAAKYTADGGHIALTVRREGARVVLSVKDNGIGIPPDMLQRVFDMFTQIESARPAQAGRAGHRADAGQAAGRDARRRRRGAQRRARARQRVHRAAADRRRRRASADGRAAAPPRRRGPARRSAILVVDDNVDAAESLSRLLRLAGPRGAGRPRRPGGAGGRARHEPRRRAARHRPARAGRARGGEEPARATPTGRALCWSP